MSKQQTSDSRSSDLPESIHALCERLRETATQTDLGATWPTEPIRWCAEAGVFRWFIPEQFGGLGWSEQQQLAGYLALSQSCLTTTFVLTQWHAAVRRILMSDNAVTQVRWLCELACGEKFATVGISHLTTSRQHLSQPVLRANLRPEGGFVLDGYCPWVTAAIAADVLVIAATCSDGQQILCAVPRDRAGIEVGGGQPLVALTSSCTDTVRFQHVEVTPDELLAGPVPQVLTVASGGGAGGLQTSTLAVGLSMAAVQLLGVQAGLRAELQAVYEKLASDTRELESVLIRLTNGEDTRSAGELRQRANSLALRTTQAALTAAKGAGFVATHSAGRMAREALFFLVWSCPQPVAAANLCEFAQLT